MGVFSFFRTANLVPRSFEKFSTHQVLSRASVTFASSGALLTVTCTNTHQAGDTALVIPIPCIPGSSLCTTAALKSLLNSVSAPASYPLFTYTTASHQHDCITATSLNNGIKHLASLACLDPQDYSGHSLRRGGATFAIQWGFPSKLIKVQGNWRSDAYMLYLTLPLADRLVLSHAFLSTFNRYRSVYVFFFTQFVFPAPLAQSCSISILFYHIHSCPTSGRFATSSRNTCQERAMQK